MYGITMCVYVYMHISMLSGPSSSSEPLCPRALRALASPKSPPKGSPAGQPVCNVIL